MITLGNRTFERFYTPSNSQINVNYAYVRLSTTCQTKITGLS